MSEQRPLVDNYADAGQVREAERVAKQRAQRLENDLRVVLALPEGRRVLFAIMARLGVDDELFDESAARMWGKAWAFDVARAVVTDIDRAAPGAWAQMMSEHKKETEKHG
jgi:hypothetical protein